MPKTLWSIAGVWLAALILAGALAACGGDTKSTSTPTYSPAAATSVASPTAAAPAATDVLGAGTNFLFVGFSDHTTAENFAPTDVVPSGGTLKACNPSSLYAFVNFTGLQQPKQLVGKWTLNGAVLNQHALEESVSTANTYWQVQNTPAALAAGSYTFELSVDGTVVSQGSFSLTC